MKAKYKIGIEREGLRCTAEGELALTPHPEAFGDKLTNPRFTVDFSESQVELITPPCESVGECYEFLENMTDIMLTELYDRQEYLWPHSLPCRLPDEELIPLARYRENGKEKEIYRELLVKKYGKTRQMLCGIHFNFSFHESYFQKEERNDVYMRLARNVYSSAGLIGFLFGHTPDETHKVSLRNSKEGYQNTILRKYCYCSFENYVASIREAVRQGDLISPAELYEPIRLKASQGDDPLEGLMREGVDHVEIRCIDINPQEKCGISKEEIEFLVCYLFLCGEKDYEPPTFSPIWETASKGLTEEDIVAANEIFAQMRMIDEQYGLDTQNGIHEMECRLAAKPKETTGYRELALQYTNESYGQRYCLKGYEDMELSTQLLIREAIKQGIDYRVLDRQDNILSLTQNGVTKYVCQANKTDRDSYISPILMNNKSVSKEILKEHGVSVPRGERFIKGEDATERLATFVGRGLVVKPQSTNFGIGIEIFPQGASLEELQEALAHGFCFDDVVLIEEYVEGMEQRFLVIDGKCVAVLHRMAANVTGDGVHTIEELIDEKNQDPLRGENHRKPFEIIKIDEVVLAYLKGQGLTPKSIPPVDQKIVLRGNSNVSTGGDSMDRTEETSDFLKQVAVDAAKAFDAVFCGVDIIANESEYAVIEVNFNPMLCAHAFPYYGNPRPIFQQTIQAIFCN